MRVQLMYVARRPLKSSKSLAPVVMGQLWRARAPMHNVSTVKDDLSYALATANVSL